MVILLALADALSESTPVLITAGATITLVSIAFGMGVVWTRIAARLERIDGKDGALERSSSAMKELRREIAALDRYTSDCDASLSARIHHLGSVAQDLQNRMFGAEKQLGYDGRGQTTPIRAEPSTVRPRRPQDIGPGDSR